MGYTSFIGIDPGQSGGLAQLDSEGVVSLNPMPVTERDIFEWFDPWIGEPFAYPFACIEKVHAMPQQGVSSTFKFGVGYGGLRMALIAAGVPFEEVTPRAWQKALGIPPRKVKRESKTLFKSRLKAKAQQLFPQERITLKTCDALLIMEYCRRTYGGK